MKMDDADLLVWVDKRVGRSTSRPERLALEEQWLTSWCFWNNKTRFWIEGGRLYDWDAFNNDLRDDIRYKVNIVRARTDTAVAKVLGVDAKFQVRPPTGSPRDRGMAELSNKVFGHVRSVADWDNYLTISTQSAAIYGTSIIKVFWDPKKGEPDRFFYEDKSLRTPVPSVLLTTEQQREYEASGQFRDLPPGDVSYSVISPFAFFYDSASRDDGIAGCQWVAERHFVDRDVIADRFGISVDEVPKVEQDNGLENYEEAIAYMSGVNGFMPLDFAKPEDKRGNRTLYIELWHRPCKQFPKGLRVCMAGKKILSRTDNPNIADKTGWSHLPYIRQVWKHCPGRFWGASLVEDMLVPQHYLNEMRGSHIAFAQAHGQPMLLVGDDTGIDTDTMTSRTGRIQKVPANSINSIKPGVTPQMSPEVLNIESITEGDINKVASQQEFDGGKMPGQIRSGAGINALNQDRYAGLSIPAKMVVRTVRDAGKITLALCKQRYGKRVVRYMNEASEFQVEHFNGADLLNDVVIVGEPDVTDSIEGQRQSMLDAVVAGAFNPQFTKSDRAVILKGLRYGTEDPLFTRVLQAERNQEREIQEMIADPMKYGDQGYPVFPWQDHESEMNALVEFMYSPEFNALEQQGPMGLRAQALVTDHYMKHQQALMAQAAMAAAMNPEQGAGEKGQPSPPRPSQQASK